MYLQEWRALAAIMATSAAACGDDGGSAAIDAPPVIIDAPAIDAPPIDAPTDAAIDAASDAAIDGPAPMGVPTAFRMNDLDLRDPHVFVNFLGCRDVTDTPLVGFAVNGELQTSVQTDGDQPPDGRLDLSVASVFRPLDQAAPANAFEVHFPSCTAPLASTVCSRNPAASPSVSSTATWMAAGNNCLVPIAGTTRPYVPAITSTGGPCYSSGQVTVTIDLAGIPLTLRNARIAATSVGNPAGNTVNGLLIGFISEADANTTILPASMPLVGGMPLSSLLPGGMNNCAPHSDKDVNAGVMGWWFYLNFTAPRVTWIDN